MPERLTAAEAGAEIALARAALESLHPGYDRYTQRTQLDALWASLEASADGGMSRGDLYVELSRILAAIRCDHTKAELPSDVEARRRAEAMYLPFSFRLIDARMFVDRATDGSGLARGDEILEIDGRDIGTLIESVFPLLPVDGDTDYVKPGLFDTAGEFVGPGLDHFAPYLFEIDDGVELEVRDRSGQARKLSPQRIDFDAYERLIGQKRFSLNFSDSVRFETLGERGAYLAVDTFVNYREPVDAVAHLEPYFRRLKDEGRDRLIVDLRENGGGSDDAQTALISYLIDEPLLQAEAKLTRYVSIDPAIKPHLNTWDQSALNPDPEWFEPAGDGYYRIVAAEGGAPPGPVEPARYAFDGELVLLTSASNASGLTHLLANLQTAGVATLIGEKTGGAPTGATAGVIFFLKLKASGITVRVPAQRTVIANAAELPEREGITPDMLAPETIESWLNGRDPALEAALEFLSIERP
ncbi:MAG: S41 family peptidase [Pseudomonadota bacterium]